eukprot:188970-Amphidinium_carterae.2
MARHPDWPEYNGPTRAWRRRARARKVAARRASQQWIDILGSLDVDFPVTCQGIDEEPNIMHWMVR